MENLSIWLVVRGQGEGLRAATKIEWPEPLISTCDGGLKVP